MHVRVKHLHKRVVKGRTYYRHRKTGERLDRDGNGNPRSMDQIIARCMAINAQLVAPGRRKAAVGTLSDLITQYRKNIRFTRLSDATKAGYQRSMDYLGTEYGDELVHRITTEDVLAMQDDWADKPRTADMHCSMLQILLNFAIQRRSRYGGITFNPASTEAGVERLHRTEGYEPWPEPLVEKVLTTATPEVCWLIDMARFTGQRAADLAKMKWSDIQDGVITVRQNKTGAALVVPVHPTLKTTIKGIKRRSLFVLTNHQGRPWRVDAMSKAIAKVRPEGSSYVLHGFRKNATINLLECGCSTEEVKAITGHSTDAMVGHYGRRVNQARLAGEAMRKWAGSANDA